MPLVSHNPTRRRQELYNAALGEETDRAYRRRLLFGLTGWLAWYAAGTVIVAWSFTVDGQAMGDLVFWTGLCVGNVGAFMHIVFSLVRATEKGDL